MARNKGNKPGGPVRPGAGQNEPPAKPATQDPAGARAASAGPTNGDGPNPTRPSDLGRKPGEAAAASAASAGSPPRNGAPLTQGAAASASAGGARPGASAGPPGTYPKRPPAAATPPPARSSGGFFKGLFGGLIGGAAVVAGAIYLVPQYLVPKDNAALDAVQGRVDQLAETVAGVEAKTAALEPLSGRVDALESTEQTADSGLIARIEALESGPPVMADEGLPARLQALAATDAKLEQQITALQTAGGSAAAADETSALVADLDHRLGALETTVADLGSAAATADAAPADAATGEAVRERLATVENDLAGVTAAVAALQESGTAGAAAAGLVSRIEALEARLEEERSATAGQLADLDQRLGQVDQLSAEVDRIAGELSAAGDQVTTTQQRTETVASDVTALGDRVASTQQQTETLVGSVATLTDQLGAVGQQTTALAGTVDGLSARVTATEEQVTKDDSLREQAAALALITGQLEAAINRAQPYEGPLKSLQAIGGDDPVLQAATAKLEPTAATGAPSLATLRASFEDSASQIIHRSRAPEGDGLLDQAAGNLLSLVTVRPVGADVQGDDPAARVARAEARLADGDLAGAVAEIEALEGPAADAAAPWLAAAKARLDAEAALASLQTRTTDLLTGAP